MAASRGSSMRGGSLSARADLPARGAPPKMLLPTLNQISPRLMDGFARAQAEHEARILSKADISPRLVIRTRQDRRPVPIEVRRAMRKLWRSDVKHWCETQDKAVDLVQRNQKQEAMIDEWFNALDMDRSGTVEEDEVAALMNAMGVDPDPKVIKLMFEAIGRPITAQLTRQEFIKFVTANSSRLTNQTFASTDGGSKGMFDSNTQLMMMAYRRQRLIEEVQIPANRGHFRDVQSFNERYHGKIGHPVEPADDIPRMPPVPPHRMMMLPNVSPRAQRASTPRRAPPHPRPPSSVLAPPPPKIVPDDYVLPPNAEAISAAAVERAKVARTGRLGPADALGPPPLPSIAAGAPAVASWDPPEDGGPLGDAGNRAPLT